MTQSQSPLGTYGTPHPGCEGSAYLTARRPDRRCQNAKHMARPSCVLAVLAAIVSAGLTEAVSTRQLQAVDTIQPQISISWNRSTTGSDPLDKLSFDDPRLADTSGGLDPSQVRACLWRLRQCTKLPTCPVRAHASWVHSSATVHEKRFTWKEPYPQCGFAILSCCSTIALIVGSSHLQRRHQRDCVLGNWPRYRHSISSPKLCS